MQGLVKRLLFGGIAGKVLGVVRELVAAWCFGTGLVANAYRLAQAAFLLPLHGFVSDVISGAFTPRYARLRVEDPAAAQRLFAAMQRVLLVLSVLVAVCLVIWGQHLVALMAPGFSPEARAMSADFVRVLAPALPAYVLVGLFAATELVHGQGRVAAARASVQSIGLLVGTAAAWALDMPLLIAAGFVCAYFALLFWAASINRRLGVRLAAVVGGWAEWKASLVPVGRVFLVLMWVPIALQLQQIVERRVASGLDPNAVAALDYARFITETLLILIAMPFGLAGQAAMPTMGEAEFRGHASRAMQILVAAGLPLSVFIWAHAEVLVTLLFKRGAFDQTSVNVTSEILGAYAFAVAFLLVAYAGQKFLNARGRNGIVLLSTLLGVSAAVWCNLNLATWLGTKVLGVAASVSAAIMMLSVVRALGLSLELMRSTWTFWATAGLHLAAILGLRAHGSPNWWLELACGITLWCVAIGVIPAQRLLAVQLFRTLVRRVS